MSDWAREEFVLAGSPPGTIRTVVQYRFGPQSAGRKVYIQAGLHADEAPGYLVAQRLVEALIDAAARNDILEQVIVVPVANPVGLSQWEGDGVQGRFDRVDLVNFNRGYPELTGMVAEKLGNSLGPDAAENVRLIRAALKDGVDKLQPASETDCLKLHLLHSSIDADIVLDLHCDHEAILHLYMGTPLWERGGKQLARQLGSRVNLLAENSGGEPFDEANSKVWWELGEMFPDKPIPPACMAVTVELRGTADTGPEQIERDVSSLYSFLQRQGIVAGTPEPLRLESVEPTPLSGVDYVKAPAAGIISYRRQPGEVVQRGDLLGTIIDPQKTGAAATTSFFAATDGLLFARSNERFARPGKIVAKIAGSVELLPPGSKLLTN